MPPISREFGAPTPRDANGHGIYMRGPHVTQAPVATDSDLRSFNHIREHLMRKTEDEVESTPTRSWNYHVLDFKAEEGAAWRSIHEVHYVNGIPSSYGEHPAAIVWDQDEGNAAALAMLDRMREAMSKPILMEEDFHANDSGCDDPLSTR